MEKGYNELDNKKLYTVTQVSKLLGVGRAKVYELIRQGLLPALKLGGLKVRKETLDDFLIKAELESLKDN